MNATSYESKPLIASNRLPLTEPPHAVQSAAAEPQDPLSDLWEALVRGQLRPMHEGATRDSIIFVSQVVSRPPALCAEATLVRSVLNGDARKALASDLGIAASTATGRYLRARIKLGLSDGWIPLVVVLAAQSRAGLKRVPSARRTYVDHDGYRCLSVSVPRPITSCLAALTPVQQQVAQWLIEGGTRETIAEQRRTSIHTVAGQVHAVFHALRATGRYALIRRACELGCFSQPCDRWAVGA